MTKKDRKIVFDKFGGRCAYCGCELNDKWQVDHSISKHNFNYYINYIVPGTNCVNSMENLMPSCMECNHYKRSLSLDGSGSHVGFRNYMLSFHKRLAKLPKKTNVPRTINRIAYLQVIAHKYRITVDKPFSGKFFFEEYNSK